MGLRVYSNGDIVEYQVRNQPDLISIHDNDSPQRRLRLHFSNLFYEKKMNKQTLRTVIEGLVSGQTIHINFLGSKAHLTRDYTVVKTKTGKGKGGSKLVELVDSAKNCITTGTPESDLILNITVKGETFGFENEAQIPPTYERSPAQAALLKESFKRLLGSLDLSKVRVEMKSSQLTEFNGTFSVLNAKQLVGRGGQIKITVADAKGDEYEVWSGRHSGVVDSFSIL